MAEGEKFNLIKAITSPFTGLYWVKTVMFSLGALVLLFVGFAVYKAYFKKPLPNQAITVQEGGTVTIRNEAPKKHLIVFMEPFYQVETDDDPSVGIRVGARWEF
jgi:hypothetical protein